MDVGSSYTTYLPRSIRSSSGYTRAIRGLTRCFKALVASSGQAELTLIGAESLYYDGGEYLVHFNAFKSI